MNLKTTFVLLVLVAAIGALLVCGQLPPALDPRRFPRPSSIRARAKFWPN